VVSVGHAQGAMVVPRHVFQPAIMLCATALVVAHNHPSGDQSPSAEDRLVTERLREAGELLGIECLDHVVLGRRHYYSFADDRNHPLGEL
jgi:DNA repair protein RadC